MNYFDNVALATMKAIALNANGDDEWFRSGMLNIISQIEIDGYFLPNKYDLLAIDDIILTASERERKAALLKTINFTPEHGHRFSIGASNAESALSKFARNRQVSD